MVTDQPISPRNAVLVVEDEPLIRMMIVSEIEDRGFNVLEAGDAHEALSILGTEAHRIGILFTDVDMPGDMNGVALARRVRASWPWIALCVASGKVVVLDRELPVGSQFFSKPYDYRAVIDHMRDLIPTDP
jgi:CheY-like chemotaxis protein